MHEILILALVFGTMSTCFLLVCLAPVWIIKKLREGSITKINKQKQQQEVRKSEYRQNATALIDRKGRSLA